MMKFVYRIFILLTVTSLWFSLSSYQSGAASSGRSSTGAPFGNGTCGSCHSGGRYGMVTVAIQIFEVGSTTPITSYVGGKTYDAKLTITATTAPPYYAFQMVAVNPSNAQAGTWSGFPTGVKATTLSSRVYVEQSTRLTANSYKMTWVAPVRGTGKVTFYACGNCINGTGGDSGDNTGTTTLALTEQTSACTSATVTTSSTNAACAGSATGSATVTPSGGTTPYTYLWSNGATTQTASNLVPGIYTVTVTEGGGCKTTSNAITVGANTVAATIMASGPTTFCPGGTVNLTASGGTTYKWSTGATTATISNIATAGTYTVTVTSGTCTSTASQTVVVSNTATANITASGATTFCQGSSVNLTASGGGTYKWSTGATTATISNITAAGTYSVTVVNGTCTATASKVVTVTAPPTATITASGATTFCQGGRVNLTASGGTTYSWSTGATTATLSNITAAGTYTVTVSNGTCNATTSKAVIVNSGPVASITASGATSFCVGKSVSLTATGGTAYSWSTGVSSATLPNITTSGTYSVTVINGTNICTTVVSQTVTASPPPTITIAASGPTTFCQGDSVVLIASGGGTYLWSNGTPTARTVLKTAGTFTVTVANGACTATSSKTTVVNPTPSVRFTSTASNGTNGTATAIVTGGTPPYIYDWNNNATNYTLIGLEPDTYFVTITDANGCTTEGSVIVKSLTGTSDVNKTVTARLSPNPNNGHFNLTMDLPNVQTVRLDIFNIIGQKVAHQDIQGKSISEQIDVTPLSMGQYLVKINTESGTATQWMVVAK